MRKCRNGVGLVYSIIILTALVGVMSLAVDYGHVELVKSQLHAAADSAARAAAQDFQTDLTVARASAVTYAKANIADGTPVVLDPGKDVFFGYWNTTTRTFSKLSPSQQSQMNAVQVFARRSTDRKTAVSLSFASLLGQNTCDVSAECIVMVIPGLNVNQNVPATANPFLAGMPAGSVASLNNPHNSPDYAGTASNPRQSPLAVDMPIAAGTSYNFDSINGDAHHDPNLAYANPDGDMDDIGHNNPTTNGNNSYSSQMYDENGIGDARIPINALVGVFLSDAAPNKSSNPDVNPADVDYSDSKLRNQTAYQPALKQIFYIGDGQTDDGAKQSFVAPPGATRLYLATWDFYEWNNNAGYRNIRISLPSKIVMVK